MRKYNKSGNIVNQCTTSGIFNFIKIPQIIVFAKVLISQDHSSSRVFFSSYSHETHKVGVIYIGPNQAHNEQLILSNEFGSLRYADFLHGLGTLIPLRDIDKTCTFLGGLSAEDGDGEFSYVWEDDVMQVSVIVRCVYCFVIC